MGTPHAPTGTDMPAGESSDSPNNRHPGTAESTGNDPVDDITAGLSAAKLESDTDSQTDSDIDNRDDDHVPEPATVRRWEVIDRIMDSLYTKLEAKITQTKVDTAPVPAPPPQLLSKPAVLERRKTGERSMGEAKGRLRQKAAQSESEEVDKKGERDEDAEKQEAMLTASTAETPHRSAVFAAPRPPPPPGSTPSPPPAPEPVPLKAKKSAGSSLMGLLARKATERSSGRDAQTSLPTGVAEPPQQPVSSSAPAARPPAQVTSSYRALAPAPPRATSGPTPDTSSHLGILGTLASALSAGGTQDVPAHLPQVIGEERNHLREQLANMYASASPASSRGGPWFGTAGSPFLHGVQTHARSAQVPSMPSQRGLAHTSIPTAPPSSRRTPQASYSTWQPPSATGSTSGNGFASLGSGDQLGQGLYSSDQGLPRQEFQIQRPTSLTPTQDAGTNSAFRGLGLPGFPQPHIHMHRNVASQEPSPPNHVSTSPLSDLAEAEDQDGEQQESRRRKSTISHLKVDEGLASDHDGRRKKARKGDNANAALGGQRKFACPYFKRNKKKYSKWTSCPGPGWDEVHRVKTHLYRRHALPIQCVRCWEVFKTDELLNAHLQQDPPCENRKNQALVEGFTKDQEKKLRSRKKAQADTTDEDKWREIYMILFPYDDVQSIPSPFYEASDYEGEAGGASGSGELEDYATFVQREMPTLVRRELETLFEKEFQEVEEPLRRRVAEIVLKLQPRLLNLYKQTQIPLSDYGPPSNEPSAGATGSEPGLTPTMSYHTPESDSTPGTNVEGSVPLGFDVDDMFDFNGILGVDQTQQPQQQVDAFGNPVFSWDEDFEKLINPTFFMPQTHESDGGLLSPSYAAGSSGSGNMPGYRY